MPQYSFAQQVPEYFAKVLTFPAPVTTFNYQELAKAVLNGPDVHPGANIIEDEFGNRILLQVCSLF